MYDLKLTESYVPAQPDGTLLDLSVGGLLRRQANHVGDAEAVTAVAADGAGRFSSGDGRHGAGTGQP